MAIPELAANIVALIHLAVVVFFLYAPFSPYPHVWVLAFVAGVFTMSHWLIPGPESDTCCLTVLERWLRGCEKKESFMHSVMSPIYKAVDTEEGKVCTNEFTSKLTWGIMIFLMTVTGLRIATNFRAVKESFTVRK
jgi:hypothetical protein